MQVYNIANPTYRQSMNTKKLELQASWKNLISKEMKRLNDQNPPESNEQAPTMQPLIIAIFSYHRTNDISIKNKFFDQIKDLTNQLVKAYSIDNLHYPTIDNMMTFLDNNTQEIINMCTEEKNYQFIQKHIDNAVNAKLKHSSYYNNSPDIINNIYSFLANSDISTIRLINNTEKSRVSYMLKSRLAKQCGLSIDKIEYLKQYGLVDCYMLVLLKHLEMKHIKAQIIQDWYSWVVKASKTLIKFDPVQAIYDEKVNSKNILCNIDRPCILNMYDLCYITATNKQNPTSFAEILKGYYHYTKRYPEAVGYGMVGMSITEFAYKYYLPYKHPKEKLNELTIEEAKKRIASENYNGTSLPMEACRYLTLSLDYELEDSYELTVKRTGIIKNFKTTKTYKTEQDLIGYISFHFTPEILLSNSNKLTTAQWELACLSLYKGLVKKDKDSHKNLTEDDVDSHKDLDEDDTNEITEMLDKLAKISDDEANRIKDNIMQNGNSTNVSGFKLMLKQAAHVKI